MALTLPIAFLVLLPFVRPQDDLVNVASLSHHVQNMFQIMDFAETWRQHIDIWREMNYEEDDRVDLSDCDGNYTDDWRKSVHQLYPSDIGIIGALGSSHMAASGAGADSLAKMVLDYRGLSFAIGGDENATTLPNILKHFNPKLLGASHLMGPANIEALAMLNVATAGATASDLNNQAEQLVKRINKIWGATNRWKMITIFIGVEDVCESCNIYFRSGDSFGRHVRKAMKTLSDGLKKTFVNLVALPQIYQLYSQLHEDRGCHYMHRYICPCITDETVDQVVREYNTELEMIARDFSKYSFAVVVQPFLSGNIRLPQTTINGTKYVDQSYFAPDCFHFSKRGHAALARSLWSNMFQYNEEKDVELSFNHDVFCPDKSCAYIRTHNNTCNENSDEDSDSSSSESDDYEDTDSAEMIAAGHMNHTGPRNLDTYVFDERRHDRNSTHHRPTRRPHHSRRTHHTRRPHHSRRTHHTRQPHTRRTHHTRRPLHLNITTRPRSTHTLGTVTLPSHHTILPANHSTLLPHLISTTTKGSRAVADPQVRAMQADQPQMYEQDPYNVGMIVMVGLIAFVVGTTVVGSAIFLVQRRRNQGKVSERTPLLESPSEKLF